MGMVTVRSWVVAGLLGMCCGLVFWRCSAERYWVRHPDEAYSYRYYAWALEGYERLWKKASEWEQPQLLNRALTAALMTRDYVRLERWAARGVRLDPQSPEYVSAWVQALLARGDVDSIPLILRNYREGGGSIADLGNVPYWFRRLQTCSLYATRQEVRPLGLNTGKPEFSAVWTPIGILFSSQREGMVHGWDGYPFADVYLYREEGGRVEKLPWNGPYHEGTPFAYQVGDTLFVLFTRCGPDTLLTELRVEEGVPPPVFPCGIYRVGYVGGRWLAPELWFRPKKPRNVGYPSLDTVRKVLYFAGRQMGQAHDVYRSRWYAGDWLDVQPVRFNTSGVEFSPYVYDTLVLFASDRREGVGNLDLFLAYWDGRGRQWRVVHLGCPVNSGADEYGASIVGVEARGGGYYWLKGLLTTNRGGNDDIYEFRVEMPLAYWLELWVHTDTGDRPLMPGRILLLDRTGGGIDTVLDTVVRMPYPFRYRLRPGHSYQVEVRWKGFMTDVQRFRAVPLDTHMRVEVFIPVRSFLKPIIVGQEFIVENIYYEYDDWRLLPSAYPVLDTLALLLRYNPDLLIEIGAHTDCRGSDVYNLYLSLKRAQSVVNYLVQKGVSPMRLRVRGYGESRPVVPCTPCEACSESEHARNRRTTFRILQVFGSE